MFAVSSGMLGKNVARWFTLFRKCLTAVKSWGRSRFFIHSNLPGSGMIHSAEATVLKIFSDTPKRPLPCLNVTPALAKKSIACISLESSSLSARSCPSTSSIISHVVQMVGAWLDLLRQLPGQTVGPTLDTTGGSFLFSLHRTGNGQAVAEKTGTHRADTGCRS